MGLRCETFGDRTSPFGTISLYQIKDAGFKFSTYDNTRNQQNIKSRLLFYGKGKKKQTLIIVINSYKTKTIISSYSLTNRRR